MSAALSAELNGSHTPFEYKLKALALELTGGHSEYDSETGMMRSANRTPPRAMCTAYPGPYKPENYVAPRSYVDGHRLRPEGPTEPKPKSRLAGWLDGFLSA